MAEMRNILSGNLDEGFLRHFLVANWVLLIVLVTGAALLSTKQMAAGILVGGFIANLNCLGLDRDCKRMVRWRTMAGYFGGLAVRLGLVALAVLAALLIFPGVFSPVGLFIGLSVAVITFYLLTLAMVIHLLFRVKEAV